MPRRICRARRTRLRAAQQRTPWRAASAIGIRALRMLRIANGVSDDGDGRRAVDGRHPMLMDCAWINSVVAQRRENDRGCHRPKREVGGKRARSALASARWQRTRPNCWKWVRPPRPTPSRCAFPSMDALRFYSFLVPPYAASPQHRRKLRAPPSRDGRALRDQANLTFSP